MAMGVQSEERASSVSTALEMMKADVGSPAKKLITARTFVLYKQTLCSKHHARRMIFAHMHAFARGYLNSDFSRKCVPYDLHPTFMTFQCNYYR